MNQLKSYWNSIHDVIDSVCCQCKSKLWAAKEPVQSNQFILAWFPVWSIVTASDESGSIKFFNWASQPAIQ